MEIRRVSLKTSYLREYNRVELQKATHRFPELAFGLLEGTPIFGLPGNPVSVFVTLLIIARPYLFACQGISNTAASTSLQRALFAKKGSAREDYLRVRSSGEGLELFSSQSSGILFSTTWGDGLVRQKVDEDINEGDLLDYIPYAVLN